MTYGDELQRLIGGLSAPRRNRYFYGKLLDVCHFEMEQTYLNGKRWLLNRQALGEGVLCGLGVSAQEGLLCVEPGMAVDAYGREIVKPLRTCIDPWTLTDPCGRAQSQLSKDARHAVTLLVCYRECLTDHMPVLVSDCGGEQDSAAGTLVETFALVVREGLPEPLGAALDPLCCKALSGEADGAEPADPDPAAGDAPPDAIDGIDPIERMRRRLCECSTDPCDTLGEPCLVLAAVELLPGGAIGRIDQCRYRPRVYSNRVLLDLILCLAARLDACCEDREEPPETPPKVASVQVLDIDGAVLAQASDLSQVLVLRREQLVRSLRVGFTQAIARATLVAGGQGDDPDRQSFLVTETDAGLVPGRVVFEDRRTVRWGTETDAAGPGRYRLRLFGDADSGLGRPAIASTAGVPLDAEPIGLPSGDDRPGGVFDLRFDILAHAGPGEPPKVASVFILSGGNVILASVTDPREVPGINVGDQPRSLRLNFTSAIDPDSLVAAGPDPARLNFRVTQPGRGPVPGTLTVEGATQVRWTAEDQSLPMGSFLLQLFGDPDRPAGRRAILGTDGLRLDGESNRPLPSGDGTEGGEFRMAFRVVG